MLFIIIDAEKREVVEYSVVGKTLDTMQKIVGGYIERAYEINDTNEIYVNEDGLLTGENNFFTYEGAHQPFAGNGVIVGVDYDDGDTIGTTMTVEEVRKKVRFMTRQDIISKMRP